MEDLVFQCKKTKKRQKNKRNPLTILVKSGKIVEHMRLTYAHIVKNKSKVKKSEVYLNGS